MFFCHWEPVSSLGTSLLQGLGALVSTEEFEKVVIQKLENAGAKYQHGRLLQNELGTVSDRINLVG
jgi:hypothetical protein